MRWRDRTEPEILDLAFKRDRRAGLINLRREKLVLQRLPDVVVRRLARRDHHVARETAADVLGHARREGDIAETDLLVLQRSLNRDDVIGRYFVRDRVRRIAASQNQRPQRNRNRSFHRFSPVTSDVRTRRIGLKPARPEWCVP